MNGYIKGDMIRVLREKKGITQSQLGQMIDVSDKTISKWENGRGLPDISLVAPLSNALGVSIQELFSGNLIENRNISGNLRKSKLYVCPICGNVIYGIGETLVCCCGVILPPVEPGNLEADFELSAQKLDGEWFVEIKNHPMTKDHYIRFLAYVTSGTFDFIKLYPEGAACGRFSIKGHGKIYAYCNRHGLVEFVL